MVLFFLQRCACAPKLQFVDWFRSWVARRLKKSTEKSWSAGAQNDRRGDEAPVLMLHGGIADIVCEQGQPVDLGDTFHPIFI